MPFTIGGDWIPEKKEDPSSAPKKGNGRPVKVRTEKRKGTLITVVLNLHRTTSELKELCKKIKTRLGCGGTIKNDVMEFQGDQVSSVRSLLKEFGIKAQ